jgi:hypothetical protein
VSAFSRHVLPEACGSFRPLEARGRRESRMRAAPAISCASLCKKCAHEHTGEAEALRLSLRGGLTAYFVLSPVNGRSCHRRPQKPGFLRTWRQHRGARTTRLRRTRRLRSSVTALASTASHRAFVTIATRPSHRVRRAESKTDSPAALSDLFFPAGLDEANRVDIAGEFSLNAHAAIELKSPPPHRLATRHEHRRHRSRCSRTAARRRGRRTVG